MNLTLEFSEVKIIVHIDRWHQYAVVVYMPTGESNTISIPKLIEILDHIAEGARS